MDTYDDIIPQQRKRNPLVLVGALATAGVLTAGLVAFRKGNAATQQKMMRARVVFQAVTVAVMAAGGGAVLFEPKQNRLLGGLRLPSAAAQQRTYSANVEEQLKEDLLKAALIHVPTLGWTDEALAAGAHDLNLSIASIGLASRGPVELVEHFNSQCDRQLAERFQPGCAELEGLRPKERLELLVRSRLEPIAPLRKGFALALSLQLHPHNLQSSLKQRAALIDEIWHIAGDASSDLSWYTKRTALAAIYSSAEMFLLNDSSADLEATWEFLKESLESMEDAKKRLRFATEATGLAAVGAFSRIMPQK